MRAIVVLREKLVGGVSGRNTTSGSRVQSPRRVHPQNIEDKESPGSRASGAVTETGSNEGACSRSKQGNTPGFLWLSLERRAAGTKNTLDLSLPRRLECSKSAL